MSKSTKELFQANFKVGDRVTYIGSSDDQVRWGSNDDPRKVLTEGDTYTIENVDVHSSHTKLMLNGITGRFNSVSFEKL
jgi:hypothetical protein